MIPSRPPQAPGEEHPEEPSRRLLWISGIGASGLVAFAWLSGEINVSGFFGADRARNLKRFLTEDAIPFPLREDGFTWSGLWTWVAGHWNAAAGEATLTTLWIAVASMALAGAGALLVAPWVARTISTREPFLQNGPTGALWIWASRLARLICILARALPEYILAFLWVAILPGSAWPAVLALAMHNGGILGRLFGETLENLERRPLQALRTLGGSRGQITALAAVPVALPRFLLYFFYRFETCVREATVLGMLGIVSLGYQIQDARSRHAYDDMLLLVGFGVLLVLLADLTSHGVRIWLRREAPR
ncbi:MAG: ABC transporter permease subunit [Planctomycetota bacterium]|nr:ABC transporter permease subunit [Planctomycetota bacterium]